MKRTATTTDTSAEVVEYFALGQHAFVAGDDPSTLDALVSSIEAALSQQPLQIVDGSGVMELSSFATDVVGSCDHLLRTVGVRFARRHESLWGYLEEMERQFQKADRQGFLVVNHIDEVIRQQNTFEIEGAFREVMQFYDDVAILWLGSRDSIIDIHQIDRPFYLSHRVFWLNGRY